MPQVDERRKSLQPARGEPLDRVGLDVQEEIALGGRGVVVRGGFEAELLELPGRLVLSGELEEEVGAFESRVERPPRQCLVPEELHRGQVEDRLVDRADAALPQDLVERVVEQGLALALLGRGDRDRFAQRPVNEPLHPHLRVRPDDGMSDEDADPLVDPGAERLLERAPQRLFDLPGLALQPGGSSVTRLEAGQHVEIGPARAVDRDEVFRREDGPDHSAECLGRIPEETVEDLPSVRLLDVAVLLDVHVEDREVAAVEEAVAQRVDDDGHGRELRDRVEEEALVPDLLVLGCQERRGTLAPLVQQPPDGLEQLAAGERLGQVVVRPDLHSGDEVPDLALDRHHRDRGLARLRRVLQGRADLPARQLRHHHVQEDQIRLGFERQIDALPPVARDENGITGVGEDRLDDQEDVLVIVDDQDSFFGHAQFLDFEASGELQFIVPAPRESGDPGASTGPEGQRARCRR